MVELYRGEGVQPLVIREKCRKRESGFQPMLPPLALFMEIMDMLLLEPDGWVQEGEMRQPGCGSISHSPSRTIQGITSSRELVQ